MFAIVFCPAPTPLCLEHSDRLLVFPSSPPPPVEFHPHNISSTTSSKRLVTRGYRLLSHPRDLPRLTVGFAQYSLSHLRLNNSRVSVGHPVGHLLRHVSRLSSALVGLLLR